MRILIKVGIILIFFISACSSQFVEPSDTGSSSSLVKSDVVCCECVPFYLCENGTINTDGSGVLDLRIGGPSTPAPFVNVETCPDSLSVCCVVPDAPASCKETPSEPTDDQIFSFFFPDPLSECNCVPYTSCDPNNVVSNDMGITSIQLSNGRVVSHSKCLHSLDVCCLLSDSLQPSSSAPLMSDRTDECECVMPHLCGPDGHIITDGGGILDLRIGPARPPQPCQSNPDLVCCLPPKSDSEFSTIPSVDITHAPPPTSSLASIRDDGSCECVMPHLCGSDGHIITDGGGLLDLRIGPANPPQPCQINPDLVCCLPPKSDSELSTIPSVDITNEPPTSSLASVRDDGSCECVMPHLCGPSGHIITDGEGLVDVRVGPSKPPPPCLHDPSMVCCLPPKTASGTSPTPHVPTPTQPSLNPPCGKRNSQGIGVRILGFQEGQTQFGEFPWVALILKEEVIDGEIIHLFQGGASLIHRRVVMTAAHKIDDVNPRSLKIRVGEWDTSSVKENLPHQDIGVESVIIHPGYNPKSLFHDVALLILEEEARKEYHVAPICPAKSLDDVIPSSCLINGWGVDALTSENYQMVMKSVRLPLVAKDQCQTLLRKTRLTKYFQLHNSFICAGGEEGVDACKGDGGGPLSCQRRDDPSRYLQVGITAWGIGCGGKDVPGVYVDVANHYDWIINCVKTRFPETQPDDQTERPLTRQEERELRKQQRKEQRQKEREEKRKLREAERKANRQRNRNRNRRNRNE